MALLRCPNHPPDNTRAKSPFTAFAHPVGYPETAVICGRAQCSEPAAVWLTQSEQDQYALGNRIFGCVNKDVKIRVTDAPPCCAAPRPTSREPQARRIQVPRYR